MKKLNNCPYCGLNLDTIEKTANRANHIRWCKLNPKHVKYLEKLKRTHSGFKHTNAYIKAKENGKILYMSEEAKIKLSIANTGKVHKKHTKETKKIISEKGLSNPYKRKCKSTCYYNGFRFDSKWEIEVAKILDKNSIKWIQPEPLKWIDKKGVKHNYFSDFYLPEYDLFLDPKNDYCIAVQKEKLDYVLENYKNIIILNKLQINEEYILNMLCLYNLMD